MMKIRTYTGNDEAAVLQIWQQSIPYDRISPQQFRTQVLLDPNFTPENLPVAVVNGQLVGFILCLTRQVPLFLQGLEPEQAWITAFGVLPAYRRQGVGTALFEYLIAKLQGEQRTTLDISPYVPNYFVPGIDTSAYPETIDYLKYKHGFDVLYHAISMGVNLTHFQIPPELKHQIQQREQNEGLTIRPIEPVDIPDVMPFLKDHFGWDWYRHAQNYLLDYFGGQSRRICFLVARLDDEVVGFCQQRDERFGPFGVREDMRGKGIGKLLLFTCLDRMRAQQVYYAYFLWTDEKAARLYTQAGFESQREFAVMRKKL